MSALVALAHSAMVLALAIVLPGIINRVKSRWSGRKGAPILQLGFDLVRLFKKSSVYSTTTTPVFRVAPWVVLVSAAASAAIAPVLGSHPPVSFPFDFVLFAYLWGLGRVALMLGALDTGSAFEGMGVARDATYSTILEPSLFLVAGALCAATGQHALAGALSVQLAGDGVIAIWIASIIALLVIVQVEAARMPVDDPTTHLELTMIHEVMILDHSGPNLAAVQLAASIKLTVGISLIATLLNPFIGRRPGLSWESVTANALLCIAIAVVIGCVESLTARLKLRLVPQFVFVGLVAASIALLGTTWRAGGGP